MAVANSLGQISRASVRLDLHLKIYVLVIVTLADI